MSIPASVRAQAKQAFRVARMAWDVKEIEFQDENFAPVVTLNDADDWRPKHIVDQATGEPEIEVSILPSDFVENEMFETTRFVLLKGYRYEKRVYQRRTDILERHQLRLKTLGAQEA